MPPDGLRFRRLLNGFGLFATHLQKDLHYGAGAVALPIVLSNAVQFVCGPLWGWAADRIGRRWAADRIGRRWAMILPCAIGVLVTPLYLFPASYAMAVAAFTFQGIFLGSIYTQNPSYLSERFPTEVRATAAGFCYHQGAIWGGACGPLLTVWAGVAGGFAMPMLWTTIGACIVFIAALLIGPETKGKVLVSDITLGEERRASSKA